MSVLLILIKRNKFWVAFSVLAALLSNLSQMFFANLIGKLVNNIESRSAITLSFIITAACFIVSNAFTLLLNQYVGRLTAEKMAHSLRMGYAKKYCPTAPTAPMYYSQKHISLLFCKFLI